MFGQYILKKQVILILLLYNSGFLFCSVPASEESQLLGEQLIHVVETQSQWLATTRVLLLVERGADVHFIDTLNRHALLMAQQKHMTEVCEILTEKGAYIPLCLAIGRYPTQTVLGMIRKSMLLDRTYDMNRPDSNNEAPVHLACYTGVDSRILVALLQAGANPNPNGRYHPLEIAKTDRGKKRILRVYGARIDPHADISWSDLVFGCSDRWKMKIKEAEKYNKHRK